jgi:RNA polymerase sigma factor (sigma-70 family)
MTSPGPETDAHLRAAIAGDRRAFESLVAPHMDRLRAATYRMLGHREDAADVVQETLLKAFRRLSTFRGESAFSTWLLHIATNQCLDLLRTRGRWRVDAQPMAKDDCIEGESSLHRDLMAAMSDASFAFDVREHIAFCFTCVARTLDAETELALLLSEVLEVGNGEAAAMLGLSESTYRHRLTEGRRTMQAAFEGLCALVNKNGACYQCKELRDIAHEDRRGPEVPDLHAPERWRRRLAIVKEADLHGGQSRALHDVLFRWISIHGAREADGET